MGKRRVLTISAFMVCGLLLTMVGVWLLLPAEVRHQTPVPNTVHEITDAVTGEENRVAFTHQGDGSPTRVDSDTYVNPDKTVTHAEDTRLPDDATCGGTVPVGFMCAPAGWLNTKPVPTSMVLTGSGEHEVTIPPSQFSGWVNSTPELGSPVGEGADYVAGRTLIVGHVNFGSWQDNTGVRTAMGGIGDAHVGDTVLVGTGEGTVRYRVVRHDNVTWAGLDQYLRDTYTPRAWGHAPVVLVTCFFDRTDAHGNPIYDKNTVVTLEAE
jgi:hypothetical protein